MFTKAQPDIPYVEAEAVKEILDSGEQITLLDVRTTGEFAKGHISGSVNVPVDQIENIEETLKDKTAKIYVYCLSGSRSEIAVKSMLKKGYGNIQNMKNGLLAWRGKGFPVTT